MKLLHCRALLLCVPLLAGCSAKVPGEPVGTVQQADTCPTGTTLEGVDVSVYDGTVDWAQVKASGRAFGIAKATEGATLEDSEFSANWPAMKSAGIVRSAYHFFHCDTAPATQATFFLGVMGTLQPGDLPPSLDFEDTTTCTASTGISMAIQWLDAVASATGTLPILYTSVNVLSNFQNTQSLAGHAQLWVASRGVTCPDLPAPFTAWSFWQYSLTGTAPGLPNSNGMADLDQFNGDLSALLGLTVGGSPADASSGSDSGPPACMASGVAGTCIDTSVCAAMPGYSSTAGLCPGPDSEQCCTRAGDASSGGAGDAGTSPRGDGGGAGDAGETDGAAAPADHGPNPPGASCGCSTALGSATSWTSILPVALLLAGCVASSRRGWRLAVFLGLLGLGAMSLACEKSHTSAGPATREAAAPSPTVATVAASATGPDDLTAFVMQYGKPDVDDSTAFDKPPPPLVTRWFVYKKEHVTVTFVPDGPAPADARLPRRWDIVAFQDDRTKKALSDAETASRLRPRTISSQ